MRIASNYLSDGQLGCDSYKRKEMTKGIWFIFVLYIMSKYAISELKGPNVCQEEQRYKVNVTKYVLRNVTVRSYQWCLQVPPRCSTYSVRQINDTKLEEEVKTRSISKCCDGYYETVQETCSPNSCRLCDRGYCDENGACRCEFGYWGTNCEQECSRDHWQDNCRRDCTNCTQGHCNISTRNCSVCPPNFIRCDLICVEGHKYDRNCRKECSCDITTTACDPLSSDCQTVTVNNDINATMIENNESLNSILVRNEFDGANKHRRVPNLPDITTEALENVQNDNLNYVATTFFSDIDTRTTFPSSTTEKNKKEIIYKTKKSTAIIENIIESTVAIFTDKSTNPTIKLSEISKDNSFVLDSDKYVGVNSIPLENKTKEKHAFHSTNLTSHNLIIDSHLFTTIISAVLFSVLIIVSAAVFCVLHKLKVKKKKYIDAVRSSVDNGKENIKLKESAPSLSVTTRSIFHTPLPEPPTFENPAFLTQFESTQSKQPGILETHVICNVNIPKLTNQEQPERDIPEFFYDRPPPSIGKYRATTLPEPPNSNCGKNHFDPIYDEIPCHQRIVPVSSPSAVEKKEQSILYMNT